VQRNVAVPCPASDNIYKLLFNPASQGIRLTNVFSLLNCYFRVKKILSSYTWQAWVLAFNPT
jgi:hypothetical protein